jgi:hypothetical protein
VGYGPRAELFSEFGPSSMVTSRSGAASRRKVAWGDGRWCCCDAQFDYWNWWMTVVRNGASAEGGTHRFPYSCERPSLADSTLSVGPVELGAAAGFLRGKPADLGVNASCGSASRLGSPRFTGAWTCLTRSARSFTGNGSGSPDSMPRSMDLYPRFEPPSAPVSRLQSAEDRHVRP